LFINGNILKKITEICKNLEELSLVSCANIDSVEEDVSPSIELDLDAFFYIKNLRNLKKLNLYRTLIHTESALEIVKTCSKLKAINFGSCVNILDFDSIMDYLNRFNKESIESLDLWRAYSLTEDGIYSLKMCPNLQELDIGWCMKIRDFDCLREMVENCTRIKKLFMTSLRQV
jgi:F-box/leucine-rich repeat protein 4